jgi:hypothetical protein
MAMTNGVMAIMQQKNPADPSKKKPLQEFSGSGIFAEA